jgi:hypothetical protein
LTVKGTAQKGEEEVTTAIEFRHAEVCKMLEFN